MTGRVHNFGAGPAAMPLAVLERIRDDLCDFVASGRSILEISHRSKEYDRVHEEARARLLRLLDAGDDYEVLFMSGGARTQFSLVAMNLLAPGEVGEYLVTGRWSELALAAADREREARSIWSGRDDGFRSIPSPGEYEVTEAAGYLHYTSNNTIYGTQFQVPPESGVPLVADMSSDILSAPLDLSNHGLIYASAQKNLGPAGVTVVLIRRDLLEGARTDLGHMFSYRAVAAKRSLLSTPPVFAIYAMGLVLKDLEQRGGLEAAAERNRGKSELLYDTIERSEGFYIPHAETASRSRMNVTFRLAETELLPAFLEQAEQRGLAGLEGHRSVGGIRASIYNGVELSSVQELAGFLDEFRASRL